MKVGVVSLIGKANSGKSSLLNSILEFQLAIVSPIPQTTRDQIKGIYNDKTSQIVFIDTPGIQERTSDFSDILNKSSFRASKGSDLVLFLQAANFKMDQGDFKIINSIKGNKKIAIITKIDLLKDPKLLVQKVDDLKQLGFETIVTSSTKIKKSINDIIELIKRMLPSRNLLYDPETITDQSMRFMAKEIIRVSIINNTFQELPHAIAVVINQYIESDDKSHSRILATIFVEANSQKGILIGANGKMIRKIINQAQEKLQKISGQKISLELKVKVSKNWRKKKGQITEMGY